VVKFILCRVMQFEPMTASHFNQPLLQNFILSVVPVW